MSRHKWYIGVDPGVDGGIALVNHTGLAIEYSAMPDTATSIYEWLRNAMTIALTSGGYVALAVEHQQPMPGNKGKVSVTATATMMRRFGQWEAFAVAMSIPYLEVRPATWKKSMGVVSEKGTSILRCEQLFPGVNLLRTPRCTKKHDGMAEALLIAEYARRGNL